MNQKIARLLTIALGCVVLFSKSAHAQERHGFDRVPLSVAIGVNVAGTFADLYTTNNALNRGAVEGFGAAAGSTSIGKVAAFRITTSGVFTVCSILLDREGHHTAARILAYGAGGAGFAAAWHNTGVARGK